jgi:hypothetical protein
MTDLQESEIRDYLLSKKLPIDILLEVQDHFIAQISDLQQSKNIDFNDAFKQTKWSWREEFKMVPDANHYQEIPKFYKQRIFKNKTETLISTLKCTIPIFLILIALAYFLKPILFKYFTISLLVGLTLMPLIYYILRVKEFDVLEKYKKFKLTLNQNSASAFLGALTLSVIFISHFELDFENLSTLLHLQYQNFDIFDMATCICGLFAIICMNIYFFLSLKKCIRQINQVKLFLINFEIAK